MKGKEINLEGVTYKSISEACRYYNEDYIKIRGRLRTGWSLEEAFGLVERKSNYYKPITLLNKKFKSFNEACRYYNINASTVISRLHYNWTLEEAFGLVERKEKNYHKGKEIILEGITYKSMAEACRYYKLDYSIVHSRIQNGWTLEEAFELVERNNVLKSITVEGVTYKSIVEAAKHYNFDVDLIYKRINDYNWSIEEAFELVERDIYKHYLNKPLTIEGNYFKSLSKACEYYNIDYSLVLCRIDKLQWSIEDALLTPVKNHKGERITLNNIEFISLAEACRYYNENYDKIRGRLRSGWSLEEAFGLVPRKRRGRNNEKR